MASPNSVADLADVLALLKKNLLVFSKKKLKFFNLFTRNLWLRSRVFEMYGLLKSVYDL